MIKEQVQALVRSICDEWATMASPEATGFIYPERYMRGLETDGAVLPNWWMVTSSRSGYASITITWNYAESGEVDTYSATRSDG
jgi:hypothetical protein